MNNLLDYSHIIKTYVMVIDYNSCMCDHFIFCYKNIIKCKYQNMIIDNLPLFKIILNKNIKKQFKLPNEWSNSNITSDELFKLILYIISFSEELNDSNKQQHIKTIISLSFYILIINNHNLIKKGLYLLKPLLKNLNVKLKFFLNDIDSINKLKSLFKEYFLENSDDSINIMNEWTIMINELINNNF